MIDVGCGFGVTLLGLASSEFKVKRGRVFNPEYATNYDFVNSRRSSTGESNINDKSEVDLSHSNFFCEDCNFLGCDLSSHAVSYARSIASRWNISGKVRFVVAPAEEFLTYINENYKGPVVWVMVQYPTPYKLAALKCSEDNNCRVSNSDGDNNRRVRTHKQENVKMIGNSQLPALDSEDSGFMVSRELIQIAIKSLSLGGVIYVQSNVEDVAVTIKNRVEEHISTVVRIVDHTTSLEDSKSMSVFESGKGFVHLKSKLEPKPPPITSKPPETTTDSVPQVDKDMSQRQAIWRDMHGERATGPQWLVRSPFHESKRFLGETETEAAYRLDRKPVFRAMWAKSKFE